MDNIAHAVVGAAVAQSFFLRPLKKYAIVVGALAANLPDVDVFFRTGDQLRNHLIHRSFTHSLIFIPFGALISLGVLLYFKPVRRQWKVALAAAFLAFSTHCLLDACTSWGTMLFWPFASTRAAWDCMPIVDPIFTGTLLVGVVWAARKRTPWPARGALALALLYIGLGVVQLNRALVAQREIAAERGDRIVHGRVMPTLGNLVAWRSLYLSDGKMRADSVRTPLWGPATYLGGLSVKPVLPADIERRYPGNPGAVRDYQSFEWFSDGFVAGLPGDDGTLADMRYSVTSNSFRPLWGISLPDGPGPARWVRPANLSGDGVHALWRDLAGTSGTFRPVRP